MRGDTASSGVSTRCSTKKENACRFCRSKTTVLCGWTPISAREAARVSSRLTRIDVLKVAAASPHTITELNSTPAIRSRLLRPPRMATRVPQKLLVDQGFTRKKRTREPHSVKALPSGLGGMGKGLHTGNARAVRVDVETLVPHEAQQSNAGFLGELDREARSGRNCGADRITGPPPLPHDLEPHAPGAQQ